jgi:signal transduction histidine kinase
LSDHYFVVAGGTVTVTANSFLPDDLHRRALNRVLEAEAWRRERVANYFRFALLTAVGLAEWRGRSGFDHDHLGLMPFIFLAWGLAVGFLNVTLLRSYFRRWIPAAVTTVDIAVLTVALRLCYDHALAFNERPDQEIERAFMGLFVLLSVNMIRFSWRTTLWSGFVAINAFLYLRVYSATLGQSAFLTDILAITVFVLILAYANRTVRVVIERLLVDLREAQERRLDSLRALVAGVTHELNSPLGAIESGAQVSERAARRLEEQVEEPGPEVRRALHVLQDIGSSTRTAVGRIKSIVRALGSFARLDEQELGRADLREALDACLDLLVDETNGRVEVRREYTDLPPVVGRHAQLNQALMHVLRNAVESIDGHGVIAVGGTREGDEAVIHIRDTGRGMGKKQLAGVFDIQLVRKESRIGMGLGLPITHGIVLDHGGSLTIESEVGVGTVVTIRLPRAPGDNRQPKT